MAKGRQRTVPPLVVAAGDVVEHRGAFREMPLGQLGCEAALARPQPVQRFVEVVLVGVFDPQLLGQRGVGPQPGGGQLGTGSEQAFDDQGHDQVALPRALGGEQPLEPQPAHGSQHGLDVALGPGAFDEEGLRGGDEGFAGQRAADDVD